MSYRRYYGSPYFGRRRYYHRRDSNLGMKFLIIIGFLVSFGIFSSSPNDFLPRLFGLGAFVLIIILIYRGMIIALKGLGKLLNWNSQSLSLEPGVNNASQLSQRDIAQINSEKHGCKCYTEGLSCGEQEVAHILSSELGYRDYFIFNNLIIPAENNGSAQIDHIVVSKFGIFVIESKDYSGWIFGDMSQPFWTQSLRGGNKKSQFQNPIHQNYAHIMALKTLMPFVCDNFYSIVVFSNKSEIKTAAIENVVHLDQLIGCIKKYTQEKLTETNLQLAIGKLSYTCQTVDITASEHVANLHANYLPRQ